MANLSQKGSLPFVQWSIGVEYLVNAICGRHLIVFALRRCYTTGDVEDHDLYVKELAF
jgi:hypothetical protein